MFLFLFLTISFIPKLIRTFSHVPPEWLPGFDTYDPVRCGLSIPFKRNINRSKRKTILDSEFKVLGGESVKEGEYPWAVYIINPVLRCTGVLISKRHVLTTAHCFKKKGVNFACKTDGERIKCCNKSDAASKKTVLSTYFIQVGSICIGEQSTLKNCKLPEYAIKYTIKKAIYNQYYENNCIGRDYAIIELGHPIPFEQTFNSINNDNEKITIPPNIANHICLLHLDDKINKLDWRKLSSPVIFGWGQSVNFNGKMKSSSFLQKAKLISLMKQEDCKNYVRRYHEDILCVISKKNISTCAGDSGGGLSSQFEDSQGIKRWFLLGVTSMGSNCSGIILGNLTRTQTILMDTNAYYYQNVIDEFIGTQETERNKWQNLINFHALEFC